MSPALLQSLVEQTARIVEHRDRLLADYEPHDLHQFRVNTRRCRSLLQRIRKLLPARYFLNAWSELFAVTNRARDLDVFLDSARALLPEDQFSRFEAVLEPELRSSHDAVTELLASRRWKSHLAGWRGFLITLETRPWEASRGRLDKVMKKARKACRKAMGNGANRDWHKLRIAVKNLRYVADATRNEPDSDPQRLDALIEDCKSLQTLLGDWHDTIVQGEMLAGGTISERLGRDPDLAVATDGLASAIEHNRGLLLAEIKTFLTGSRLFSRDRDLP